MESDFSAMGKAARELLPVPDLPIDAIRTRTRRAAERDHLRTLIVCSAIGMAVLCAAAVGEKLYDGVRVWLSGNKAAVTVRSLAMVREPMASDVQDLVGRATFPIIFPVGVPAGTRVTMMLYAPPPPERPNVVSLSYRNGRTNFNIGFTLVDTTLINAKDETLPSGSWRPPFRVGYQWQIGRETVLVAKSEHITPRQVSQIEAAMIRTSPADSLTLTDNLLRRVTVLGASPELADFAEHYAPPSGRSVLLDPQLVDRIPSMAKQGKPVVDDRTIYLTNIPSVNGEPDYSKATLHWPRVVVVPARGVRAIDEVLRFTDARRDCRCVILVYQPRTTVYWIWKIALSTPHYVRMFSVDAHTLAVVENPKWYR